MNRARKRKREIGKERYEEKMNVTVVVWYRMLRKNVKR